jgi:hypothetical protein
MNKEQQELLEKAKEVKITDEVPEFKGIYIIQQRKLHDSGYRMMYVIGHTELDEKKKDFNYYLIGTFSDVIDFTPTFERYLNKDYTMCDLHLDINRNGIIHIWTNSSKHLVNVGRCSNCMFEIK